ncbi:MAG: ADP-ribosylglycohydrolase family protein [Clostridia bacterium]|nr:ADP-ribosylglycohydrolase family protein [Clostridia bacterium]
MRRLSWETYLDKVYGCFLGKAVVGTMGAPFEGVKMPLAMPFDKKMIDSMLPNDDLDFQILWLDVCEEKGPAFTSADLLARFTANCDYSPGEYAVMRRNYMKRIMPPLSGKFGNDNYIEGMGCPIRSEIWACLAPGDANRAADYAYRDGCMDHEGASIDAERFLAALESEAFFESDLDKLIEFSRKWVPSGSRLERLISDTLELCAQSEDTQWIFRKIHRKYGHPDCTNLYQNIAITLIALKKSRLDFVQTGLNALNLGFDTDCTCATAGAIIGTIRGAKDVIRAHALGDVKYVLSVRAKDRGNRVEDLARDVAMLGVRFMKTVHADVQIVGAPELDTFPDERESIGVFVEYENGDPSICFGETKTVCAKVRNFTGGCMHLKAELTAPEEFVCRMPSEIALAPFGESEICIEIHCPDEKVYLNETNIFTLGFAGEANLKTEFGLSGSVAWKVVGPYWETNPRIGKTDLIGKEHYGQMLPPARDEGDGFDIVRQFHLNYYPNTEREYVSCDVLLAPLGTEGNDVDAERFDMKADAIYMDELFGLKGPCTAYLSRIITSPEDISACLQVGHSCPFTLWLNGKEIGRRDSCDRWTNENVHLVNLPIKKGDNTMIVRLTRVNDDAKISLTFSKGASCSEYLTCFGCKNPRKF